MWKIIAVLKTPIIIIIKVICCRRCSAVTQKINKKSLVRANLVFFQESTVVS